MQSESKTITTPATNAEGLTWKHVPVGEHEFFRALMSLPKQ
jgi:hypothetical protein